MREKTNIGKPVYSFLTSDIEVAGSLAELALDLRWSWNHAADKVWRQFNSELWELTHNPWVVLQTVSKDQFQRVMSDTLFHKEVDDLLQSQKHANKSPSWFPQNYPKSALTCAAYFSMEFMLSEALPIYSGGLGNVAGDQFKTANDLGLPEVGIGLLYQQGYFRQVIDKEGRQQALFPYNDPEPGTRLLLQPVTMLFNYQESFSLPIPEAYETLLWDVMQNDATLLMRADQVEAAWQIIMPLLDSWPQKPPVDFPIYAAGTWGPEESNSFFNPGHHWPVPTEINEKNAGKWKNFAG